MPTKKFQGGINMIINHNASAEFASRSLRFRADQIQNDIETLSSGRRINRAGDDAAGLAVSEKLRTQVRGLNQAERNIQDGVSFIQTTEGYLNETSDVLQRIRELAVQSGNGIYTDQDRQQIQVEVAQLIDEVDRIASHAQFNELNLLTGRFSRELGVGASFHIGANMDQNEIAYVGTVTTEALGITDAQGNQLASISTAAQANSAIGIIDNALFTVNRQRADLGAYQSRFELAQEGVAVAAENLAASESRIRDADFAEEVVDYVRNQILIQSNTAMLAQANVLPQSVLQILG